MSRSAFRPAALAAVTAGSLVVAGGPQTASAFLWHTADSRVDAVAIERWASPARGTQPPSRTGLLPAQALDATQTAPAATPASPTPTTGPPSPNDVGSTPIPAGTPLPGRAAAPSPSAGGAGDLPSPARSAAPADGAGARPSPGPSASASPPSASVSPGERVHLHRPGTDVEGDQLSGNVASDVYVISGNVMLHSDPKIDTEIGAQTESDEPLTVTADEIDIDKTGTSYVAKGHVRFTQGQRTGSADLAMLNENAHTLDLIGHADVREGDRRAAADKMHYNTSDKAFLGSGNVRIFEPLPTPKPRASGTPSPKRHKLHLPI